MLAVSPVRNSPFKVVFYKNTFLEVLVVFSWFSKAVFSLCSKLKKRMKLTR